MARGDDMSYVREHSARQPRMIAFGWFIILQRWMNILEIAACANATRKFSACGRQTAAKLAPIRCVSAATRSLLALRNVTYLPSIRSSVGLSVITLVSKRNVVVSIALLHNTSMAHYRHIMPRRKRFGSRHIKKLGDWLIDGVIEWVSTRFFSMG